MEATGIVIPCYNENKAITRLIDELDGILTNLPGKFELIVVDDSSSDNTLQMLRKVKLSNENVTFRLIQTVFNQGHQSAIFQGLCHALELNCWQVIVMDGDGEDDPAGIPLLLEQNGFDIVNVKRGKRSENFLFRFFYAIYKLAFLVVTGKVINFGNYCLMNRRMLETAVSRTFISFPGFLLKVKASRTAIVIDRRKRLDGKSKMSLNGMVYHGFRSFSEFAEEFILFMLKIAITLASLFLVSIAYVVYEKLFTDKAILGWASTLSATFFNSALISFGFFFIGVVLLNIYHKTERRAKGDYKVIV